MDKENNNQEEQGGKRGGKKHYWKFVTSVQEKTRAALDTQKATENPQQVTNQTLKLASFLQVGVAMEAMQSKPSTLTPTTKQHKHGSQQWFWSNVQPFCMQRTTALQDEKLKSGSNSISECSVSSF